MRTKRDDVKGLHAQLRKQLPCDPPGGVQEALNQATQHWDAMLVQWVILLPRQGEGVADLGKRGKIEH